MNYTELLDSKMDEIQIPQSIHCDNAECKGESHSNERDNVVLDILVSIIEATHLKIPMTGGRVVATGSNVRSGSIPGWKLEVEPFQSDARFWHSFGGVLVGQIQEVFMIS